MPRKASEAVPEGNGPILQEEFGSGQPTMEDVYRMLSDFEDRMMKRIDSCFDRWDRKVGRDSGDETRVMEQHLTSLEPGARQPRLAMEADRHANTKTRERTEGAATAVPAMQGDSWTTPQKVQDGPMTSITSGVEAEPPDLPRRDDVMVEGGDAALKSCLPLLEIRSPTPAGGSFPTGETSTSTETSTFNEPLVRPFVTEESNLEKNVWTSIPSAWHDSSFDCFLPPAGAS